MLELQNISAGYETGLVLRNIPVPPRPDPRTTLTIWQRTLGYSLVFDLVQQRLKDLEFAALYIKL